MLLYPKPGIATAEVYSQRKLQEVEDEFKTTGTSLFDRLTVSVVVLCRSMCGEGERESGI